MLVLGKPLKFFIGDNCYEIKLQNDYYSLLKNDKTEVISKLQRDEVLNGVKQIMSAKYGHDNIDSLKYSDTSESKTDPLQVKINNDWLISYVKYFKEKLKELESKQSISKSLKSKYSK